MALTQHVVNHPANQMNGALLEKVIIGNDLSGLSSVEKVMYVKNICQTLGLNPVTKPIQLMKFQGKEVPYFTKDASEQLRKINKVSITKIETKVHDGGLYVATAYASTPDGRQDTSTGAIVIAGLRGDALANAMMKAETKSKRRVTLSICGLGFIDEMEVDSLPNVQKIDVMQEAVQLVKPHPDADEKMFDFSKYSYEIAHANNVEDLRLVFERCKKSDLRNYPDLFEQLVSLKDNRKLELSDDNQMNDFLE